MDDPGAHVLHDLSIHFEKVLGLAASSSAVLFTIAFVRNLGWRSWIAWLSAFGALEFAYRVPTIIVNAPIAYLPDLFRVVWMLSVGIWLAFSSAAEREGV